MAIIQLQKQYSPWERMLPQILGQLALTHIQQNFQAKQNEMELSSKVSLAGGKKLTKEETKSPTREGYRRVNLGGKTYSLPLSTEEQLQKQNIFKLGENLYRFKDGGVTRITEKKSQYQPQLFTNEKGDLKWIEPGTDVPEGYTKYTAPKTTTPKEALTRISNIRKEMAKFDENSIVTQALAAQFPKLAPYLGQKAPKALKENVFKAWNNELNYLYKFTPSANPLSEKTEDELINMIVGQD